MVLFFAKYVLLFARDIKTVKTAVKRLVCIGKISFPSKFKTYPNGNNLSYLDLLILYFRITFHSMTVINNVRFNDQIWVLFVFTLLGLKMGRFIVGFFLIFATDKII